MTPTSDQLETFIERARQVTKRLNPLGSNEVNRADLKDAVAGVAREWLRLSPALREVGACDPKKLDAHDHSMQEALSRASQRVRASALKKHLVAVIDNAVEDVIVPVIKFEGSPRQVAARQLQATFSNLNPDETAYVGEAARCVTVQAHRAALIMLWAATVARFHTAIELRGFDAFNKAVDSITAKKGPPFNKIKESAKVSSYAELQRGRDADMLVVGMELFGYDLQVYQELDRLLGTRNDAAHPGMSQPGALDVQQFATKIQSYVFQVVTV